MSIDWNWGIFLQQAPFGNTTYLGWIWSGFQVTIALSICAWIIAFLVGSFFGILRTVPNRFLSGLGTLYVELFRNVPPELFQLAPETTRAVSETQPAVTLAH